MFTADVAVDDQNEIAQASFRMLAHSQGMFCRVEDFRISTTAPAVGLSGVPQKTTKAALRIIGTTCMHACFLMHNPPPKKKKNYDSYSYVLVQQ